MKFKATPTPLTVNNPISRGEPVAIRWAEATAPLGRPGEHEWAGGRKGEPKGRKATASDLIAVRCNPTQEETAMVSIRTILSRIVVMLVASAAGACGEQDARDCVPGESADCSLGVNWNGTHVCSDAGKWLACQVCNPGELISCHLASGETGAQMCAADGRAYGGCESAGPPSQATPAQDATLESEPICIPGEVKLCRAGNGMDGVQSCLSTGLGYSTCVTSAPPVPLQDPNEVGTCTETTSTVVTCDAPPLVCDEERLAAESPGWDGPAAVRRYYAAQIQAFVADNTEEPVSSHWSSRAGACTGSIPSVRSETVPVFTEEFACQPSAAPTCDVTSTTAREWKR